MAPDVPRLVIAGATSGVGKTTIAAGIMGALRRRGLEVQAFKVGPDYIDPSYHAQVTGRPCRNLDSWMVPQPVLRDLFTRAAGRADIALVEGVMGLFDGRKGADESGSTAEVAKLLQAPVVLVLDVSHTARSAGAMALGYKAFDPRLNLAGFILNRVGSETHRGLVTEAVQSATGLPVLGHLPRRPDLVLPERHLGLIPTAEGRVEPGFFDLLITQVEESMDVSALELIARSAPRLAPTNSGIFPPRPTVRRARIALARDEAFSFYYEDSLDLLEAWGAELAPFSPLHDSSLPDDVDGVYLGGGFPELFAADLSENRAMHASLQAATREGAPIYGECGGLMYLLDGITDLDGRRQPMAGLVPGEANMVGQRLKLSYLTARARQDNPLLAAGDESRGHEFHWSELRASWQPDKEAYDIADTSGRREGYVSGNLLASYVHLHFGANPRLAPRFVDACARWRKETRP